MSIRKKHISRYYTIVEVMVAMGIFLIMMTIMMQFFTSAQKVWNLASKKNMLYADARVAMNLMTREIQSMLYNNDDDGTSGIYPFWHEWTETNASLTGSEVIPQELEDYWVDNKDLFEKVGGASPKDAYLTVLNFIATTDIKAVDYGSDICEIRYKFIPVYFETATPASANDVQGGKLQRSCMEEYTDPTTPNSKYNLIAYEDFTTPANRVKDVFTDAVATDFQTVITGVYSLRFTCYTWNSGLQILQPMSSSGTDITGATISGINLVTGTPKPVAVRIDMKLMDPKDLKKLAYNIYVAGNGTTSEKKNAEKQIRTLKQAMRTFSKVIYLGKSE